MKILRNILLIGTLSISVLSAQEIEVQFDHEAILVKDLSESAQFYMNVIGLKEIEDGTGLDHIRWFSLGNNTELHIIEDKNHKQADVKGVHFALRVNDLDMFIKHLQKQKIGFENWFGKANATNDRPDGIRQVYLKDPSGYWIEINGK
ncbi:VOC family protein [Spongiivirga citrea]|uniref:VOC family protein n=1 Tax=Spongiivirga citrea TaxID=1481457 RepID=A0A6M0CKL3_9FLAO|nr:VOC family protein [Spongiivirga citrea]NER15967.1 VOC family protein [Spongiivirga citrea]